MKLYRVLAIVLRHLYEARHNLDRLADTIYWPVLDIIMWGFFTAYLSRTNRLQPGIVTFLLGAIILWGLFRGFQRDMAVGFLAELWSRNLANLFSTPLSISEYISGLLMVNLLKAALGLLAAAAVAWVCYAYGFLPMLPAFLPHILNLLLFGLSLGLATGGLILRYSTRIQGLAYFVAGLLMPFSCVFYPLYSLPSFLRPFAWILPTTHSFEGMRQTMLSGGFSSQHFGWALALNAFYIAASMLLFHRLFRSAVSNGLLTKIE